jgi:hypothetical protein
MSLQLYALWFCRQACTLLFVLHSVFGATESYGDYGGLSSRKGPISPTTAASTICKTKGQVCVV